jgi:octaprenyl-diphosphate synthase
MENFSTDPITYPILVEYEQFEKTFPTLLSSTNRAVDVLLSGLTTTKGKFIRPILVFLTSKSLTPKIPRSVYHLASAVELLHQGSLLHDDVIDESERRRGEPSANKLFGNKKAILLGDLIVSRSLLEIVLSQSLDCVNSISRLIETLAEGEIVQLDTLNDDVLSEELYFDIISKKTASLFSLSARLSAELSGASQADVDSFARLNF